MTDEDLRDPAPTDDVDPFPTAAAKGRQEDLGGGPEDEDEEATDAVQTAGEKELDTEGDESAGAADEPEEEPDEDEDGEDRTARPLARIGGALRRLRMHRGLRQYEAAEAAGITKAMLSAYETGKRRPSLKTLDSLLGAMGSHLGDLHRAMVEERRGYRPRRAGSGSFEVREAVGGDWSSAGTAYGRPDLYELLGVEGPLPREEERALEEMLRGFLKLLRFMHHNLHHGPRSATASADPADRAGVDERLAAGRGAYDRG